MMQTHALSNTRHTLLGGHAHNCNKYVIPNIASTRSSHWHINTLNSHRFWGRLWTICAMNTYAVCGTRIIEKIALHIDTAILICEAACVAQRMDLAPLNRPHLCETHSAKHAAIGTPWTYEKITPCPTPSYPPNHIFTAKNECANVACSASL